MQTRSVARMLRGQPASDGGGVRLNRVLSFQPDIDPFLMLDEFNSANADDYIAGFPSHPHRGFETVTYMLEGRMLHEDHAGNSGLLVGGGAQWMTAGRGIIHSEMPQQEAGRMRGFQLWINLPAAEKMKPAHYRDLAPEEIPTVSAGDARVRVVAGRFEHDGLTTTGPINGISTDPLFLDVNLAAGGRLELPVPAAHTALVYVFVGNATVGDRDLATGHLAITGEGDTIALAAEQMPARMLVLAGRPLREPMVHYGPFVMNTRAEIEQALTDYQSGRLTA